jgi:hypothetical protein
MLEARRLDHRSSGSMRRVKPDVCMGLWVVGLSCASVKSAVMSYDSFLVSFVSFLSIAS